VFPLFNTMLVKLKENEYRFFFTVHHLTIDGWSAALFFKQFGDYYQLLSQGKEPELKPADWSYADFCLWQSRYVKTGGFQSQFKYWQKKLENPHATPPLPNQKRLQSKIHGGSIRSYVEINPEITGRLKKLASENNASLFMVLTALLHLQIHKYTGATDIATGTAIANRNFSELDQIFGLFTNALVLRNEIKGNPRVKEFLEHVKSTTLEAYENQDVPFDMLLKSCARTTPQGRVPLFKISMLLQNLPWPEMEFSGIKMRYYELGSDSAKMDLYIVFEERDGGLYGWYEYDTELFDEQAIKTIFNHYLQLAEKVTANPDGAISEIQLSWENMRRRPGCYITGETALTKAAGDILLNNGFYINGIFTEEAKSLEWALEHEIPCHPPKKQLISDILSSSRPDYLFSIINSCVLDQHILDQPLKYAINYHDAPLPRYAGLYSTAWAIINHEPEHAVTWHQMTVEIDAGDILKQQRVPISPYDTSVSLNVKCAQAALGAFESLVHDLKDGSETPVAQDLSKRTYNAQNRRPDDACVIDFNQNVEEISALARALDFGDYDNPLGTLKFACGDTLYMVKELSVTSSKQNAAPGSIIEVNKDNISIAAGNGVVKLSGICDLEGNPADIAAIGLQPGQPLTEKIDRKRLDLYYKECAAAEMFWTKRLLSPQLPEIAILETAGGINSDRANVFTMDSAQPPGVSPASVFALFLARISCSEEFDIPIAPACSAAADFPAVFADTVPFRIKLDFSKTVEANLTIVEKSLKSLLDKKTFCRDIFLRFTHLHKLPPAPYRVKINGDGKCELELFQQDTEQFLECYHNFCANMHKSMTSPLRSISILPEAEESGILYEWNKTARDFDLNTPYIRQFEKQAEKYPDKNAVKSDGRALTYKELDHQANCLAELLLQQITGGNRIIGVLTDKSLEMAVAIVGIFKAGCTYVPLDIQRQSPERIEAMIYDSGAEIILSAVRDKSQEPKNIPGYVKIIDLSAPELFTRPAFTNPLKSDIAVTDTAYIMYTSGSTGVPKGVMISQSNLLNHNYSVIGDYALTEKDNVLQFSTLGFDISVEEIFPCWLVGGTLVFMPDGMLESPEDLFLFINQERISFLDLPTSYWHEIAAMLKGPEFPECVRVIAIGGEKASPERFARWRKCVPGTRVINTYGPTETTVIATLGDDPETIGRPMANTHVYVLDKLRQPVPRGASGELYIGGASVAKGYLNKPAETAAAFMDNPFVKGERMYKTGDKVKFAPNGELIFAGRMDDQFKIRGFRVEPGDIETVLASHPDIHTAVVKMWLNEKTGIKSLAAYFVPAVKTYNLNNIREYAKSQLPEYMVPASFTAIDSIPMTPNGKINRKALPQPAMETAAQQEETHDSSEPRNQMEMQLRLIFRKLLNRDNFDRSTSFFELGGDSLSAIKLALEIEKATGIKIPVNELYRLSSIDTLSSYLQGRTEKELPWNPVVLLTNNGDQTPLFLIHTTPGDVLGYINLVNYLDNRPVYGIQAYGLHDPENAHKTIEEMATYYIAEILKICPDGPYHLCGWCFGGIVAYEMAQQLKKMGRKVAFLGLIETYANLKSSLYNDFYRLISLLKSGPKGCIEYLTAKLRVKFGKDRNIEQLDFISQRFAEVGNEQTEKMKMVYQKNMNAGTNYSMDYYDGKISLFMVKNAIKEMIPLPLYGWKNLSRQHELFIFPADHRDVLKEPNVLAVAEKIIECMVDAERNSC
jgi:amino acid adenylation domain-containing protein